MWIKNLLIGSLAVCFITVPLPIKIHNGSMIFTAIIWLTYTLQNRTTFRFNPKLFFLISALFWLSALSLVYTIDFNLGLTRIETKLPVLVWPLIILGNYNLKIDRKTVDALFYAFSLSVVLCCLYCHYHMVLNLFDQNRGWDELLTFYQFQTSYLSEPINIHPTYFSIYVIISIITLAFIAFEKKKMIITILHSILILYLILFLFLLASRGALLSFIVVIIMTGFYLLFSLKRRGLGLSLIVTMVSIFTIAFVLSFNVRYKFYETINDFVVDDANLNSTNSVTLHYRSWMCSLELMNHQNMLMGVGVGDDEGQLNECYSSHGWNLMREESFNSHNEYLTILMRLGLVGLASFAGMLVFAIYSSIAKNDFFMMMIMMLFIVCFIGESFLETQKGITAYWLFLSMLVNRNLS